MVKVSVRRQIKVRGCPPIFLRNGTSDVPVFRQIFMDGEYDIPLPFQPEVIVDLGANIGLFSLLMHQRYPGARIIAVEAEAGNYQQMRRNLSAVPDVHLHHKAIWSSNGTVEIGIDPQYGEWGANISTTLHNHCQRNTVESITMQRLMELEHIQHVDLLKIDIEGAEEALFDVSTEWLRSTQAIVIELHDFMKSASSNRFIRALGHLERFEISPHGEHLVVINRSPILSQERC
jgi:FkbM family methyltransferase